LFPLVKTILTYCVLTHTDGFTYSAPGLAKLMGMPRRSIQDQIDHDQYGLRKWGVFTLKERLQTKNKRELFLYDFHPEAIQTMLEGIGRLKPNTDKVLTASYSTNKKNNQVQVPENNKENVQSNGRLKPNTIGRASPNDFGDAFKDFGEPNPIYKDIGKTSVLRKSKRPSIPAPVSDDPLFKDPAMIDRMMND